MTKLIEIAPNTTQATMKLPVEFEVRCMTSWLGAYEADGSHKYEARYGATATVFGHRIADVDADYTTPAAAIRGCKEAIHNS